MDVRFSLPLLKQFATGPNCSLLPSPARIHFDRSKFNNILQVCLNSLSIFLPSPVVLHASYISGPQSFLLQRYYKGCSNIIAYGFLSFQLHKKVKQCCYRPGAAQNDVEN